MKQPMNLYTVNISIPRKGKSLRCRSQILTISQSQAEASVLSEFHQHVQNFLKTRIDYEQFCAGAEIKTTQHTEPTSIYFNWELK